MAERKMLTAEDRRREMQKRGLRPSVEGLHRVFDLNPGTVIQNHFDTLDGLEKLRDKMRTKHQEMEIDKRSAHRVMLADDTEVVVTSVRKGEAPRLGANPLDKIEAVLEDTARVLKSVDVAQRTTQIEITEELLQQGYLGKVAATYHKEKKWQPKASTPYSKIKAHEGALDELVVYATPLLIALEVASNGELTTAEMSALHKELQTKPDKFPSLGALREETRSRVESTPLAQDIQRRAEKKAAQSEVSKTEAAEAARYRASGRMDQAATNVEVQEAMAAKHKEHEEAERVSA